MDKDIFGITYAVTIGDIKGLKNSFNGCIKAKGEHVCRVVLEEALIMSEQTAIDNYTVAMELDPENKSDYKEIRSDEMDHKNIIESFKLPLAKRPKYR